VDAITARDRQVWSLLLDHACRRLVEHLQAAEQPFVMLKGATIAGWLYPDPGVRTYDDLDVLVPPEDEGAVIDLLGELGYRPVLDPSALRVISPEEQPLVDDRGVTIDLHVAIKGIGLEPAGAWQVLHERAVPWPWAGAEVPALDVAARTMHLALHLSQRGLADTKAARDLALGLQRLDESLWEEAADLARRLDALQAFTAGLLLIPEGARLVDRLGLGRPTDAAVLMSSDELVYRPAVALERLLATSNWRQRLATAWSYLFPTAAWLRHTDPLAAKGSWGLRCARVRRPLQVLGRAAWAARERHRFRRSQPG
jgi:hypothetical protein